MHAGLRKVALVQPSFYFNRVAIDSVARKLDRDRVELGFFDNPDAAKAWLKG
jgi:hypothetical protein